MFDLENIPEGASHEFRVGPVLLKVVRAHGKSPLLLIAFDVFDDPRPHAPQHITLVLPKPGEDPLAHDFAPHITYRNRKRPKFLGKCTGADLVRFFPAFEAELVRLMSEHTERVTLADLHAAGYSVCHTDDAEIHAFVQRHVPRGGMRNLRKLRTPGIELFLDSLRDPEDLEGLQGVLRGGLVVNSDLEEVGTLSFYPHGVPWNPVEGWYMIRRDFVLDDKLRTIFERIGGARLTTALEEIDAAIGPVLDPPEPRTRRPADGTRRPRRDARGRSAYARTSRVRDVRPSSGEEPRAESRRRR